MLDDLLILFGRFHPLIIHLPIGFIVLGILIELNKKKLKWSKEALQFIFFWASLSGLFSIITGYFQYQKEGYLWETIQGHLIAGILTVILSFTFYLYLKRNLVFKSIKTRFFTFGHILLLTVTGHLGGNITHGEDHLTEPINNLVGISSTIDENAIKYYDDFAEKPVFTSLIQPLLDDKCVKCHNDKKSKGGLKMHNIESLKQGGKNGLVINFDSPVMSEIFIRIHLPKEEKKHMPPKGGKQLTKEEIDLISKWIKNGSSFTKSVKQFNLDSGLLSYFFASAKSFFPIKEISSPNIKSIKKIKEKKILINPINKNSNYLKVSSLNYSNFNNNDLLLLQEIKKNIVSLDLSNSNVSDSIFLRLSEFTNLTVLKLNNTKIKGQGIDKLSVLENLKRINLVNTEFNVAFLETLTKFKSLEKVYLFQESRNFIAEDILPNDKLDLFDFGDYKLEDL
ncbi:hypothetical protein OAQ80_02020 [Flavobacteriaceae bacterium]|nr:hypothetical protein [Flavobacteriaceae bacterium]